MQVCRSVCMCLCLVIWSLDGCRMREWGGRRGGKVGFKSKSCGQAIVSITLMVAAEQGSRVGLEDNSTRHANRAVQKDKGHDSYARQGFENLLTGTNTDTSVQKAAQDDIQHLKNLH